MSDWNAAVTAPPGQLELNVLQILLMHVPSILNIRELGRLSACSTILIRITEDAAVWKGILYRHYSHTRMLRARKPSVRQPICLAPKLRACAYANTVPCVRQHRLPPLLVTVTSVRITDSFAVVDPTWELLEWFLSIGLCGSGTDLF
jgi:hypothetical protein